MNEKVTFAEIWKNDSKVRTLAVGMMADGMLLIIMAILAAVAMVL
jgi:hypothetical protein